MGEYIPTSAPTRAQTWFLQPPKVTAGCWSQVAWRGTGKLEGY